MADLKNNMFRTDIVIGVNVGNKTQMETYSRIQPESMDCQNSVCLNFLHELLTWGKIPCNSVSDLLAFLHHSLF